MNGSPLVSQVNTSTDNDTGWGSQGLYFKAGDYVQESGTSSVVAGEVHFFAITAAHL